MMRWSIIFAQNSCFFQMGGEFVAYNIIQGNMTDGDYDAIAKDIRTNSNH